MRTRTEGKGENSKHEKTSKDRVTKHREKLKLIQQNMKNQKEKIGKEKQ